MLNKIKNFVRFVSDALRSKGGEGVRGGEPHPCKQWCRRNQLLAG